MHGIYAFLYNKNVGFDFGYWAWEEGNFDENNWYQELCTVDKNGELEPLCPQGDYRGRDSFFTRLKLMAAKERWNWSLEFTESILKNEVASTLSILKRELEKEVGTALAEAVGISPPCGEELEELSFEEILAELLSIVENNVRTMKPFMTQWALVAINAIKNRVGPFALDFGSPYDSVRTYLLPGHFESDPLENLNAEILFVDIHT